MVLVDTSVWIDALNGNSSFQIELLTDLLIKKLPICITPTILQEILQGIKNDEDFERVRYNFGGFKLLEVAPEEGAVGAANIYRLLRRNGVTIRKSNDCLIAFYAIQHNVPLLYSDRDFDHIARFTNLAALK